MRSPVDYDRAIKIEKERKGREASGKFRWFSKRFLELAFQLFQIVRFTQKRKICIFFHKLRFERERVVLVGTIYQDSGRDKFKQN